MNEIEVAAPLNTHESSLKIRVDVKAFNSNNELTGIYNNEYDLGTIQLLGFICTNILDAAETIKDTGGTGRSITANSSNSAINIVAGTGTTAAAVSDYNLQTQSAGSSGTITGTVTAPSGSTFTVTGTITNSSGGTIAYSEVGIECTSATFVFLLAHDVFTALNVSNGGTLAVTYTATIS